MYTVLHAGGAARALVAHGELCEHVMTVHVMKNDVPIVFRRRGKNCIRSALGNNALTRVGIRLDASRPYTG